MEGKVFSECEECGSRFRFKEEFKSHMKKHLESEMFEVEFNNYSNIISTVFKRFFGSEQLADVTLTAGGQIVKAHAFVLTTFSSFFREALGGLEAWQHPVVVVKGVAAPELEALLEFMYTGVVSVPRDRLRAFVEAGVLLRVQGIDLALGDTLAAEEQDPAAQGPASPSGLPAGEEGELLGAARFLDRGRKRPLDGEDEEGRLALNGTMEEGDWSSGDLGLSSSFLRESKQPKRTCHLCHKPISSTNFSRHLKVKHPGMV